MGVGIGVMAVAGWSQNVLIETASTDLIGIVLASVGLVRANLLRSSPAVYRPVNRARVCLGQCQQWSNVCKVGVKNYLLSMIQMLPRALIAFILFADTVVSLCALLYFAPVGATQVQYVHFKISSIVQLEIVPLWGAVVIAAVEVWMTTISLCTHRVLHK
jgi:hypothetical protein